MFRLLRTWPLSCFVLFLNRNYFAIVFACHAGSIILYMQSAFNSGLEVLRQSFSFGVQQTRFAFLALTLTGVWCQGISLSVPTGKRRTRLISYHSADNFLPLYLP